MPACKTCTHPLRSEIDPELLSRVKPLRFLAARYGLSPAGLLFHRNHHIIGPALHEYALRYPKGIDQLTLLAMKSLEHTITSGGMASIHGIRLAFELLGAFPEGQRRHH